MPFFECIVIESPDELSKHLKTNSVFIGEQDSFPINKLSTFNPQPVLNFIDYHRSFKTEYEHQCMVEANRLGVKAHQAAKLTFHQGASELEVHLAFLKSAQCSEHLMPYDTIVGFGGNGAILHYNPKQNQPNGKSMLIDAGVQFNGYASDITRTYSAQNDDFAVLIKQFDLLQQRILNEIKVGIPFQQLHEYCIQQTSAFMVEHNFVTCSLEQCLEAKLYRYLYPHGLGHFIGLQVHDVAGYMLDERGTKQPRNPDVRCQLFCPLGVNYLSRLIVISYSCFYLFLYFYLIAVFFDNSRNNNSTDGDMIDLQYRC